MELIRLKTMGGRSRKSCTRKMRYDAAVHYVPVRGH